MDNLTQALCSPVFFEDAYPEDEKDLLTNYMPTFIATRAIKPGHKIREKDLV
jgi:hypothetical protein